MNLNVSQNRKKELGINSSFLDVFKDHQRLSIQNQGESQDVLTSFLFYFIVKVDF